MTWHDRFDRLLKGMAQGEPHKAEKRAEKGRPGPRNENEPPPGSPS